MPQGLHSDFPDDTIFLLGVNMYGLVTAAYLWYKELCGGMQKLGWTVAQGDTDVCMWRKDTPAGPVYVAVHVDDGVLAGFDVEEQIKLLEMAYKISPPLYDHPRPFHRERALRLRLLTKSRR